MKGFYSKSDILNVSLIHFLWYFGNEIHDLFHSLTYFFRVWKMFENITGYQLIHCLHI